MSYLEIKDVRKSFGAVTALDKVGFSVSEGEFFTLLGPSGCGKTTLLRCIAGFEQIDSGMIMIGGRDVSRVPPEKRDMGFVFQRYALFPTMTVGENVAFGLAMRKVEKEEKARRVTEAVEKAGLAGLEHRKPNQLSGGQQQRVALARALVIRPHILLLDEPLSNLDANLRIEMRAEIRRLQQDIGITTLYVTHDQEEAFALSDRVLVISRGRTQQIASPHDLYFKPQNRFVAGFIGQTNLFTGNCLRAGNGTALVQFRGSKLSLAAAARPGVSSEVSFSVRPERVCLNKPDNGGILNGSVARREFRGSSMLYHVDCGKDLVLAEMTALGQGAIEQLFKEGDEVSISFDGPDCTIVEG